MSRISSYRTNDRNGGMRSVGGYPKRLESRLLRLEGWKIALAHPQQELTQLN